MTAKMTDQQVRAELERIDPSGEFVDMYKYYASFTGENYKVRQSIFPLLAESQQALWEIAEHKPWRTPSKPPRMWPDGYPCKYCEEMIGIARDAVKGGK